MKAVNILLCGLGTVGIYRNKYIINSRITPIRIIYFGGN
jgi:hypothetical protein